MDTAYQEDSLLADRDALQQQLADALAVPSASKEAPDA